MLAELGRVVVALTLNQQNTEHNPHVTRALPTVQTTFFVRIGPIKGEQDVLTCGGGDGLGGILDDGTAQQLDPC